MFQKIQNPYICDMYDVTNPYSTLKPASGRPTIFLRPQLTVDNEQTKYAQVTTTEKSCTCDWFLNVGIMSYKLKLFNS